MCDQSRRCNCSLPRLFNSLSRIFRHAFSLDNLSQSWNPGVETGRDFTEYCHIVVDSRKIGVNIFLSGNWGLFGSLHKKSACKACQLRVHLLSLTIISHVTDTSFSPILVNILRLSLFGGYNLVGEQLRENSLTIQLLVFEDADKQVVKERQN